MDGLHHLNNVVSRVIALPMSRAERRSYMESIWDEFLTGIAELRDAGLHTESVDGARIIEVELPFYRGELTDDRRPIYRLAGLDDDQALAVALDPSGVFIVQRTEKVGSEWRTNASYHLLTPGDALEQFLTLGITAGLVVPAALRIPAAPATEAPSL